MLSDADARHVADLDAALVVLNECRVQLEEEIRQTQIARASYAPVYTLCEVVLRLVFEAACRPYRTGYGICEHWSSDMLPRTLSHVCRRWRMAAVAFPSIWRYVYLADTLPSLKLSLGRAGDLPIHVVYSDNLFGELRNLSIDDVEVKTVCQQCELVLEYLLLPEYRSRWKLFSISTAWTGLRDMLFRRMRGIELPGLKHLDIDFRARAGEYDPSLDFVLPTCPRLHTLALNCQFVPTWGPVSALQTLHDLRLSGLALTLRRLQSLSLSAPNLVSIEASGVRVMYQDGPLHSAPFLRLRSFTLCGGSATDFLLYMDIPAVMSLALPWASDHRATPTFPVYPYLRSLKVNRDHWFNGDLAPILQQAPNLTSLELINSGSAPLPSIISGMAPSVEPGRAPLMPRLEKLAVTCYPSKANSDPVFDSTTCDALIDLARQRAAGGCPLREVALGRDIQKAWGAERVQLLSSWVSVVSVYNVD